MRVSNNNVMISVKTDSFFCCRSEFWPVRNFGPHWYRNAVFTSKHPISVSSVTATARVRRSVCDITHLAYVLLSYRSYHLSPLNTMRHFYLSKVPSG